MDSLVVRKVPSWSHLQGQYPTCALPPVPWAFIYGVLAAYFCLLMQISRIKISSKKM